MCEELGVSRSGYYAYEARKRDGLADSREAEDYADFLIVKSVYDFKGRPKGSRAIAMLMPKLCGVAMNRKKIRRLMRKYGLECPIRRANPLRRIAKALQSNSVFSNKLNRQFMVGRPGEHLLTDISYLYYGPHGEKRCYLSAIKDASTNEIVAWTVSETIGLPFVVEMLRRLDSVPWLPSAFVLHSDQGCHYTSREYRKYLSDRDICQSMSRRGNCWDNAPMESFFGHAKDELRLRRCSTFGEVVAEIADYIDYYNNWRPQAGLGKMAPAEFREYLLAKPICLPVPVAAARENGNPSLGIPVSQ